MASFVIAMTDKGFKCYGIPAGAFIDLTYPISPHQFDQWDATGDVEKMTEILGSMNVADIKQLFRRMGVPEDEIPKTRKDALVKRFVIVFNKSVETFLQQHPEFRDGSRVQSYAVSVPAGSTAEQITEEVKRQVPVGVVQPSPDTIAKSFAGKGYKIGADPSSEVEDQTAKEVAETSEASDEPVVEAEIKGYIKPHITVMMGSPEMTDEQAKDKKNYTPDQSGNAEFTVELCEPDKDTIGCLKIKLEAASQKFVFLYHYSKDDKIRDALEMIESAIDIPATQLVLFYKAGNSYFMNWEPIAASVRENDHSPEVRVMVRALGGGKTTVRKSTKKAQLTKSERLSLAQKEAQKVYAHEGKALECISKADELLTSFSADVATSIKGAIEDRVKALTEDGLSQALAVMKENHNKDWKLKQLSHIIFGASVAEAKALGKIISGILETSELLLITAVEKSEDDVNDAVSMKWLTLTIDKYHQRKIGARENVASSVQFVPKAPLPSIFGGRDVNMEG